MRAGARRRSRGGFTFIELLIVVIILGLLALLGLLKYTDLRNSARAAAVAGDIRVITVAALNYQADHQDWPPEAAAGATPAGMEPFLPGFSFTKPEYTLDWDNFSGSGTDFFVGVTVTSTDLDLLRKMRRTLGSQYPFFSVGNSLTYIIVGVDGAS